MYIENNENQNNNVLWFGLGLIGGAIITYWLMKNELDKQKKELETHLAQQTQELAQVQLEKEQELKKIKVLEQQLIKLENLTKKGNYPSWGSSFLRNLVSYLGGWGSKKISEYLIK